MMFIKSIDLRNFRNYEKKEVEFQEGMNLIRGKNGEGKTNLLEAVYYLGHLISFRTSSMRDLIRWGSNFFFLRGEIEYEGFLTFNGLADGNPQPGTMEDRERRSVWLETAMGLNSKRMRVNGAEVKSSSNYLGCLEVVPFSPDSLLLVKGLPQERRGFLDRGIFTLNSHYQGLARQYYRVLQRKNYLLKMRNGERSALEVWNDQLITLGSQILWERMMYVGRLNEILAGELDSMSFGGSLRAKWIKVFYASSVLPNPLAGLGEKTSPEIRNREDLQSIFAAKIREKKDEEMRRGLALIGPHRDDLIVHLREKDLKKFGSQGEQRFSLFLVIMAMVFDFRKVKGFYPVLLLDDLISELDSERKNQVFQYFPKENFQALLTSTEDIFVSPLGTRVHKLDLEKIRL